MATYPPQDRLVRKEVSLGTLREMVPPLTHIGLSLCPWFDVASDDVIFDYAKGLTDGLAPARAEDAESELAQKDLLLGGTGRAAVIDWALKDRYSASDVSRYQENVMVAGRLGSDVAAPRTITGPIEEFRAKIARDDALRRRKLDNRIEWLIMTALSSGALSYNDGKIKFSVDYGRPADQHNEAPPGGLWSATTSDPIGDVLAMQEFMYDTWGVRMTRALTSRKVLNSMINSDRFVARSGLAISPVAGGTALDPFYLIDGWGPDAAKAVIERATNVKFVEYDSVYRTRPVGSTTITNNRFTPQNQVIFFPDPADVAELDDAIGFAKLLTSPHPEGNWQTGFYEWEDESRDPWENVRGTGVKAFPVFPHMELTFTMNVIA